MFFLLVFINGIASTTNAQAAFPLIANCDSIEIEAIYPSIFTIIDISGESYEMIPDSKKRKSVIRDSIYISMITDSINSINLYERPDGIDVRGKIICYLSHGKKVVFYVGQWSIQFDDDIYEAPYSLFEWLYLPFREIAAKSMDCPVTIGTD